MKVSAIIALGSFPYWRNTIHKLAEIADEIYVNWDKNVGDPEILRFIEKECGDKLGGVCITESPWQCPNWREECMRLLDDVPDSEIPDIVVCPDQDEVYGDGIMDDLMRLHLSEKDSMQFHYDALPSSDGRVINEGVPYPPDPHVKAFKYRRGLSYLPYHGDGKVAQYHNSIITAKSKIKHYTAYTPAMEAVKPWRSHTNKSKGVKAVTMIGFGPSSQGNLTAIGEVWTLNNGYDVLCPELMSITTRIFEMHQREKLIARDRKEGTKHWANLGKQGDVRRIIMQSPHDDILGSERYPLDDIIASNPKGMDWWAGSPIYMLAMAIYEGYNHIRIYGLDQRDFEHVPQRECFGAWCSYAMGLGITIDGSLTYLEDYTKRYAYDYGPEFDEYQEDLLWRGHPEEIQIRYKMPSRARLGKAFEKGGK